MAFLPLFQARQVGNCDARLLQTTIQHRRILRLQLTKKHIHYTHASGVSSMQLDPIENHYLISSGTDKKVCIYDTWSRCRNANGEIVQVACIHGSKKFQHKKTIDCVQWYPHDTGMFVTSSFDGAIKIWDTNKLRPVETMEIKQPIYNHHLSPISSNHSLIAAASSIHVRLADMRTGSTAHVLKGHRGNVLCVRWSPKDEHILTSGSEDSKVLVWDVRQAKAILRNLDQHNGRAGTKTSAGATAHTGSVNSLLFNEDGRFLLSFGTDHRMRLWNADTGNNALVNYGRVENNSTHRHVQMSMHYGGLSSTVLFVPSGRDVILFDLFAGSSLRRLTQHFSNVRCCEINPSFQELYTAAQTSKILVWRPPNDNDDRKLNNQQVDKSTEEPRDVDEAISLLLQDDWSDDE